MKPTFVFGCCSGTSEIVDPERKHAGPDGNEGHAVMRLWCTGRDDHGLQPRVNDAIGILVGKAVWCKSFGVPYDEEDEHCQDHHASCCWCFEYERWRMNERIKHLLIILLWCTSHLWRDGWQLLLCCRGAVIADDTQAVFNLRAKSSCVVFVS